MKKNILFVCLTLISVFSIAQTDFRTAIQEAEGIEFTEYWNIYKDEDGQQITDPRWKVNLVAAKNEFGTIVGIDAIDLETEKKHIEYRYTDDFLDHYGKPAFIRNPETKRAYAIIEGVLFEFEKMSEDGSNFSIDALWFPKKEQKESTEKVEETGKKKKLNLKGKMSQLKASMAGNPLINEFKEKDLDQMVKDYFAEMKSLQSKNPLTAQQKKEVAAMQQKVDHRDAEIKSKNAAYWNSDEGKRVRQQMREENGQATKWTVVNNTSSAVDLGINGQTKHLNPGDSWEVSCLSDVYYMRLEGTIWKQAGLIGNGNSNCGKTINLE